MSGYWIYAAVVCTSICFFRDLKLRIMLSGVWIIIFRHTLPRRTRYRIMRILALLIILSIPLKKEFHEGRVREVRDSYQIVQYGPERIMVYGTDLNAGFDDWVCFTGELQPISSYDNFELCTFETWTEGNNIIGTVRLKEYASVRKGFSLRQIMYDNNEAKDNGFINRYLFATGDSDDADMITASGMQVSFLAWLIRYLLGKHFYPDRTLKLTANAVFLLGVIFAFPYSYVRVFAGLLCEMFIEERRDRTSLHVCIMCLYRPYYVRSLSFLIPMGIRMFNLFFLERRKMYGLVYIILVQLQINGYCNIADSLLYSVRRWLGGIQYAAYVIMSLLPVRYPLKYYGISCKLPELTIRGKPGFFFILGILVSLFSYDKTCCKKHLIAAAMIMIISCCQCFLTPFYRVAFLDVGQGDCAVITAPFSGSSILIDTGGSYYKDVGKDLVYPYLLSRGIWQTDVIISHYDHDHAGGLETLKELGIVRNVYDEKRESVTISGIRFDMPIWDRQYEDINDNSIIVYCMLGDTGFLFLGDISREVEEELVSHYNRLQADIVKIAHHGSKTSTSERMLAAYQPRMAVISAGRNNYYNHPDKEVTDLLRAFGCSILCTKEDHAIEFLIFRGFYIYHTAAGRWGMAFN